MNNESASFVLFECQFYNDLRHGSVIEKATLGNQGLPSLRCFFSLLSTKEYFKNNIIDVYIYIYIYIYVGK